MYDKTSTRASHTSYLRWAKTHPVVRFELSASGAPPATLQDFDPPASLADLRVKGAYGDDELIRAISCRYGVSSACVVPVCGASSANFIALAIHAQHGDTIAVEQPVYEPIRRAARFLGLRIVPVRRPSSESFEVCMDDLENALADGARTVVLTNLHNPSGQLVERVTLQAIVDRLRATDAALIVDEVYLDAAYLNAGRERWTAASVSDNVTTVNSLTKIHGLGGLRVGWLIAGPTIAERARDVVDLLHADFPAPSSEIALQAFACAERFEDTYRRLYEAGQPVFRRWLADEPLVGGYESFGALFELVRLPGRVSSLELNELLVAEFETQVVPGAFFDLDGHFRVSLASPAAELEEAFGRISAAIRRLCGRGGSGKR